MNEEELKLTNDQTGTYGTYGTLPEKVKPPVYVGECASFLRFFLGVEFTLAIETMAIGLWFRTSYPIFALLSILYATFTMVFIIFKAACLGNKQYTQTLVHHFIHFVIYVSLIVVPASVYRVGVEPWYGIFVADGAIKLFMGTIILVLLKHE